MGFLVDSGLFGGQFGIVSTSFWGRSGVAPTIFRGLFGPFWAIFGQCRNVEKWLPTAFPKHAKGPPKTYIALKRLKKHLANGPPKACSRPAQNLHLFRRFGQKMLPTARPRPVQDMRGFRMVGKDVANHLPRARPRTAQTLHRFEMLAERGHPSQLRKYTWEGAYALQAGGMPWKWAREKDH